MPGAEFILCIIEITQTEIESAAGFLFFFHDKIFSQTHDIFIFIETGARGFFGSKFLKIK